jgi:predicted DNA-binding WGR domain protein
MALKLISQRYAEFIDRAQNKDKFYLALVWQDLTTNDFVGEVRYGRNGSNGAPYPYYTGPSQSQAQSAVDKKWYEKQGEGYQTKPSLPSNLNVLLATLQRNGFSAKPVAKAKAGKPLAATVAAPIAPPAIAYTTVLPPQPLVKVDRETWERAVKNPDYIPVPAMVGTRIFLRFDAAGVPTILVVEPDPSRSGGYRASITASKNYTDLISQIDKTKVVVKDSWLDGWVIRQQGTNELVIGDVLFFEGQDVRLQPYINRYHTMVQIFDELEAVNQLSPRWSFAELLPRETKQAREANLNYYLRNLGATYGERNISALISF